VGTLNFDAIFNPKSVAVLGASATPDKIGYNCLESIVKGGFKGKVYPVHPRHSEILGLKTYKSILDVEEEVDLAVICLNQFMTVEVLDECAEKGVRAVIAIASGFREIGGEGEDLEKKLLDVAQRNNITVLGPNTLGVIDTHANFYATFYPMTLRKGSVSMISQSGGIGLTTMYKLMEEKVGLAKWVGIGNRAMVDFYQLVKYLGEDEQTDVICIFMEGTEKGREFVEACRETGKPVIVYKIGRDRRAEFPIHTHTAAMAGNMRIYQSAFKQYGIIQAGSVRELVAKAKALSLSLKSSRIPKSNRTGVLTISAGPSLAFLEHTLEHLEFPNFNGKTLKAVGDKIGGNLILIIKNPLDVASYGFLPQDFKDFAQILIKDSNIDLIVLITIQHENWRFPCEEIEELHEKCDKPFIICYPSEYRIAEPVMEKLQEKFIPLYTTPEEAAWGATALWEFAKRFC
jgi:acetyltransferase